MRRNQRNQFMHHCTKMQKLYSTCIMIPNTAQEDRGRKAAEEEWNYYSAGPVVQVCQHSKLFPMIHVHMCILRTKQACTSSTGAASSIHPFTRKTGDWLFLHQWKSSSKNDRKVPLKYHKNHPNDWSAKFQISPIHEQISRRSFVNWSDL